MIFNAIRVLIAYDLKFINESPNCGLEIKL